MITQDKELKSNVILQNGDTQAVELYSFNHHWIVYTYLMNEYGGLLAYSRRGYTTYAEGLNAYNQAVSDIAQDKTSECGQAGLLLLILIVGVILLLYVSYSGVSILSGSTNILSTMLSGLSEVLR